MHNTFGKKRVGKTSSLREWKLFLWLQSFLQFSFFYCFKNNFLSEFFVFFLQFLSLNCNVSKSDRGASWCWERETLGQVDVYLHEERRNFGIKTTPANKFPEFKEARRISSFLASFKILRIMECYCSNFQPVFRQSLSFYSISRRLLWEPEVAFPRRQSSDKLMNIFQGDKDLEQTLTTFWRRQLKWGCKSTHEVAKGGRLWCFRGDYNPDSFFGRVGGNYVLFWVKRQVAHSAELALPILGWAQIPIITTMTYFLVLLILDNTL